MRRAAGSAATAVVVMLSAGACTGQASSGAGAATTGIAPCRAADLALRNGPGISPMTGEHGVTYALVNRGSTACGLAGYPSVTLDEANGTPMKFRYTRHSQYVTAVAPRPVTLPPGAAAYVLVAKYRCDSGTAGRAVTIRLTLPGPARIVLVGGVSASASGVSTLSYCRNGPDDPGQLVAVSPIVSAVQAAWPAALR